MNRCASWMGPRSDPATWRNVCGRFPTVRGQSKPFPSHKLPHGQHAESEWPRALCWLQRGLEVRGKRALPHPLRPGTRRRHHDPGIRAPAQASSPAHAPFARPAWAVARKARRESPARRAPWAMITTPMSQTNSNDIAKLSATHPGKLANRETACQCSGSAPGRPPRRSPPRHPELQNPFHSAGSPAPPRDLARRRSRRLCAVSLPSGPTGRSRPIPE
jgi:hypothetical protein